MVCVWKKNEKIRWFNGFVLILLFKYFNLRYVVKGVY